MNSAAATITANTDTATLVESLLTLDAIESPTSEERMARAWICDALESAYPEVIPALDAWADDVTTDGSGMTYAEALVAALPKGCR